MERKKESKKERKQESKKARKQERKERIGKTRINHSYVYLQ